MQIKELEKTSGVAKCNVGRFQFEYIHEFECNKGLHEHYIGKVHHQPYMYIIA